MSLARHGWYWLELLLEVDEPLWHSANEFAVLVILAKHANAENGLCFPSMKRIARRSGQGRAAVSRALRALQLRGVIHIRPHERNDRGHMYQLLYDSPAKMAEGRALAAESTTARTRRGGSKMEQPQDAKVVPFTNQGSTFEEQPVAPERHHLGVPKKNEGGSKMEPPLLQNEATELPRNVPTNVLRKNYLSEHTHECGEPSSPPSTSFLSKSQPPPGELAPAQMKAVHDGVYRLLNEHGLREGSDAREEFIDLVMETFIAEAVVCNRSAVERALTIHLIRAKVNCAFPESRRRDLVG